MNKPNKLQLDPVLHQTVRTRLVAFLAGRGEATFKELKELLQVTDGNLDAHVRKLVSAGYLSSHKDTGTGRTQTYYALTRKGENAFREYVESLHNLLNLTEDIEEQG